MRVRSQHPMLSLTVNTRHFVCKAHLLNCTVTHQFDPSIMTHFTEKETEVERVLSNLTRHSQVTEEPRYESNTFSLTVPCLVPI